MLFGFNYYSFSLQLLFKIDCIYTTRLQQSIVIQFTDIFITQ